MRGPGRQKVLGGVASPAGFGKPPLNVTGGADYNETIVATAEMSCMIRVRIGCILMALTAVLGQARPGLAAGEDLSRIGLAGEVQRTTRRLAAADELAAQEKWADAI